MRLRHGSLTSRRHLNTTLWAALISALLSLLFVSVATAAPLQVSVLKDRPDRKIVRYRLGQYDLAPVKIGATAYTKVSLGKESPLKQQGAPELPTVNRSLIIADDAEMAVRVLDVHYVDIRDVRVAPSKGVLYRSTDPSTVPYTFGPSYQQDSFFPGDLAKLRDPYILRDHRGVVLELYPFQYNPVSRVLRVYQAITVELYKVGAGKRSVLKQRPAGDSLAFSQIYKHHFINFATSGRYTPLNENGAMLVIAHDAWLSNVQPLVDHKNAIGLSTALVGVASIGNTDTAIKNHIQTVYNSGNLAFVLLVGDVAQIATPSASGGASDPSYAKLAGSDDYPDVIVGRFSAETAAQVDTQVQRTVYYENQMVTLQSWFKKGIGIASDEGPGDDGEMDYEHVDNIRTDLLGYGYTVVDHIVDPGAQASAVSAAVNEGRGIINYCGHGSPDAWATTGFANSDVDALTNENQLPFIISVACNNGEFNTGTCFGEAWLRATNNGNPTGAIGVYASSIGQSWDPPMAAQDETVDLLVAESYFSFGALAFAGSCLMMDEYASDGVDMYNTWHVFGDPSVRVVGTVVPPTGLIVDPWGGFKTEGDPGGPFTPTQKVYDLSNGSTFPINFTVAHNETWHTISPMSGTIQPGATTQVTVSLNTGADALTFGSYQDTISFTNTTDNDGDCTRAVELTVGIPHKQYDWPLDTDPGWSTDGNWGFGTPTGSGASELGYPDPTSGNTGTNVYGYNLSGDYSNNMSQEHLTTARIDCSPLTDVSLRFWRWLNVEHPDYDHASVSVSTDGSSWSTVWDNKGEVTDSSWKQTQIDLSDLADNHSKVYVRWTMGATDSVVAASGWNVDDIEIWGILKCADGDGDTYEPEALCGGEDCDDNDENVNPDATEVCNDLVDNDCDGDVDGDDTDCPGGSGGAGGAATGGAGGAGGGSGGSGGQSTGGAGATGGANTGGQGAVGGFNRGDDEDNSCGCRLIGGSSSTGGLGLALLALGGLVIRGRRRNKELAT